MSENEKLTQQIDELHKKLQALEVERDHYEKGLEDTKKEINNVNQNITELQRTLQEEQQEKKKLLEEKTPLEKKANSDEAPILVTSPPSSPSEPLKKHAGDWEIYFDETHSFLDFTSQNWQDLKVTQQISYAKAYQQYYCEQNSLDLEQRILLPNDMNIEIILVLIPPGKFWRGSPETEKGHRSNETTHKVLISKPFWCGKYPITQEQWTTVIGNAPSHFQGNPKNPVEQVSWEECQEFCKRAELQMLTEAQWEYTCRGGTTTSYSFGEEAENLEEYAWNDKNSGEQTHPLGEKKANSFELYDMYGNVWEWCQDYYGDYPVGEVTDPVNNTVSTNRVYRGGAWDYSPVGCRSANRDGGIPNGRFYDIGLRVCKSL